MNFLLPDPVSVSEENGETNGVVCPYCRNCFQINWKTDLPPFPFQAASEEQPPAYTAVNGNIESPTAGFSDKPFHATSPMSPPDVSEKVKREPSTPQSPDTSPASATTSLKSPITGVTPTAGDELLRAQLAEARAQIQRLKERLSDQGLKQRKVGGDTAKAPAPVLQQQQIPAEAGVPLQMVAGLCLISFLLAYFFF